MILKFVDMKSLRSLKCRGDYDTRKRPLLREVFPSPKKKTQQEKQKNKKHKPTYTT